MNLLLEVTLKVFPFIDRFHDIMELVHNLWRNSTELFEMLDLVFTFLDHPIIHPWFVPHYRLFGGTSSLFIRYSVNSWRI